MIYDTFMIRDELSMLQCRMSACSGFNVTHVMVQSAYTHRGIEKPLMPTGDNWHLTDTDGLLVTVTDTSVPLGSPWANEHRQRNLAWPVIDEKAADTDWVLICDVDEIPSFRMLAAISGGRWETPAAAIYMRTFLFAVDWEADKPDLPPTCVAATAEYVRSCARSGMGLAEIRDQRGMYPTFKGGGWHFSWVGEGGPEWQRAKLDTATCHTEILATPEAALISSGARWRSAENGGGIPVRPVEVDGSWPAYVYDRRCPESWFRPRS